MTLRGFMLLIALVGLCAPMLMMTTAIVSLWSEGHLPERLGGALMVSADIILGYLISYLIREALRQHRRS